jgi:hypothetical protein
MSANEILAANENEINIYPNLAISQQKLTIGFNIVF